MRPFIRTVSLACAFSLSAFMTYHIFLVVRYPFALFITTHAHYFSTSLSSPLSHTLTSYTPRISSPDLRDRLERFLRAPILSYDDAIQRDTHPSACGGLEEAHLNANRDQLSDQWYFWTSLGRENLGWKRVKMVKWLEGVESGGGRGTLVGKEGISGRGRGIVMTGGNRDTVQRLLVTLRILRHEYESALPVEIFTFPGEIQSQPVLSELASFNASVIELTGHTKSRLWKNFQIKADAIIHSSFDEVLYLDSDNIPLRDPTYLFDAELFSGKGRPGVVLWPDIFKDSPGNPIWRLTGKTCYRNEYTVESGQMLIRKSGNGGLNLAALHLASHMQANKQFYFRLTEGDKDTFRYAFWVLGLEYSVSPAWLGTLGFYSPWNGGRFCGIAMLQYDILPSSSSTAHPLPMFIHANLLKHQSRSLSLASVGGPFQVVKRTANQHANSSSLDGANMHVYHGARGSLCLDLEMREESGPGRFLPTEVVEERFEEMNDGKWKGFGEVYRRYGGAGGGGW